MVLGLKKSRFLSSGFPLFRHVSLQLYRNASLPFPRRNLHCDFVDPAAIATRHGTAAYVHTAKTIEGNYCRLSRDSRRLMGWFCTSRRPIPTPRSYEFFKFGVGDRSDERRGKLIPILAGRDKYGLVSAEDLAQGEGTIRAGQRAGEFRCSPCSHGEKIATFLKT